MKKRISRILLILLAAVLAFGLVACNPGDNGDDDGKQDFEKAKFKVVYVTNGGTDFSEYNLTDVENGSYISAPKDKDGKIREPYKKGYTFNGWTANGTDIFNFDTTRVTSNLTLTAKYSAKTYAHNVHLYEDDKESQYKEYVTKPASNPTSTYDAAVSSNIACPSTTKMITTGKPDRFCYWYYYDEDGNKVRFTAWADVPETSSGAPDNVAPMSKYTFDKPLDLYAMWLSGLPSVTVNFKDSMSENVYGTQKFAYKESIPKSTDINPFGAVKQGYEIAGWYYIVKDSEGKDVKKDFLFFDAQNTDDEYTELDYTVTSAENEFADAELTLYAKWTKLVTLSDRETFQNYYNAIRSADESSLEELLSAKIEITADINLNGAEFESFFGDNEFNGVIDGKDHTISNLTLKGVGSVSLFGKMYGTLKDLNLTEVSFKIEKNEGAYAQDINVSPLVTVNGGRIDSCKVSVANVNFSGNIGSFGNGIFSDSLLNLTYGGIAARNLGTIEACVYTETGNGVYKARNLLYGGITAVNKGLTTGCGASVNDLTLSAYPANAADSPSLKAGILVGVNDATLSNSKFSVESLNVSAIAVLSIGGAAGANGLGASMNKLHGTITSSDIKVASVKNAGVSVGGLNGVNNGIIGNCYADVRLNVAVTADDTVLYVGGVSGASVNLSSSSPSESVGKIYASYSTGEIKVDSADAKNLILGVAGVAGRNFGNTVTSVFSLMDITVLHDTDKDGGENGIDYIAGLLEGTTAISEVSFFSKLNKLNLNGTDYAEDADGKGNFEIAGKGQGKDDDAVFKTASFLKDSLGFDEKVWRIETEGQTLPVFID